VQGVHDFYKPAERQKIECDNFVPLFPRLIKRISGK